jgi:hypothetical protein
LASAALSGQQFVEVIAQELFTGVEAAVECWMAEVEAALDSPRLTTLGRLQAIGDVVRRYKQITGKTELRRRPAH